MPELDEESGTTEEQVEIGWEEALSQNFAKASEEPEESPPQELETAESSETEVKTDSETDQDSPEPLEPLEQWSDENKEVFKTLDREIQSFLLARHKDMEGDYTRKTQELAEERKRFEAIEQVLKPYEEVLSQSGQQVAPVVAQALNLLAQVSQDPAGTVKQAIQAYGLTPEQLGLAEEDDLTDPTIKALRQQVADLEQRLTQVPQQTQNTIQTQEGQAQIDAFANAKNDAGDPLHPYFDQVRERMAPLVANGETLEDAYNNIVWSIPEYREAQIKAEQERVEKESQEKAEKARAEKAAKAKSAETLGSKDVDKSDSSEVPELKQKGRAAWNEALQHTLSTMQDRSI